MLILPFLTSYFKVRLDVTNTHVTLMDTTTFVTLHFRLLQESTHYVRTATPPDMEKHTSPANNTGKFRKTH